MDDRLRALLLSRGVPAEELQRCRTIAQARRCSLSQVLVEQELISAEELRSALSTPSQAVPQPTVVDGTRPRPGATPQPTVVDPFGPSGRAAAEVPARVGPFDVRGLIAEGGMGVVYRAYHDRLQREVALKVLSPELRLDDETRERFVAEARMAAKVGQHQGLVRVYDAGCDDDQVWMAMELVEGTTLQDRVEASQRRPREDATLLLDVCDALTHVHAHGIIHRDLKPPNVLIDRSGRARLSDFGIAKTMSGGGSLTTTGSFLGTPAYMPPEQAEDSRNVDARSDVYGVGAILYALLCGRAPYVGGSAVHIMASLLNEQPPLPRDLDPDVDPALEAVCLRALERNPSDRYADVAALRAALEEALAQPAAEGTSARRRAKSDSARRRRSSGSGRASRDSGSGRASRDSGSGRSSRDSGSGRLGRDSARLGKRGASQRLQPKGGSPALLIGGLVGAGALILALLAASGGGGEELPEDLPEDLPRQTARLEVESLTPAAGLVPGPQLTLRGKASRDGSLVVSASPRGHDAPAPGQKTVGTQERSFTTTLELSDGEWALTVSSAGQRLLQRTFTIDGSPPALELDPTPTTTELDRLTLRGVVRDAHEPSLWINEQPVSLEGGRFEHEVPLAQGENAIALRAEDAVGNRSEQTVEVERASLPLSLLPKDGQRVFARTARYRLECQVSPPSAQLFVRDRLVERRADGRYEVSLDLRPGENTVPVRAEGGGKRLVHELIVVLDDRPPQLTLVGTPGDTTEREVTLALRFDEEVVALRVTREGKALAQRKLEPTREAVLPLQLEEGKNALRVQAKDVAGNVGAIDVAYRVDSLPPKLNWTIRGKRIQIEASDPSGVTLQLNGKALPLSKRGRVSRPIPTGKVELVAVDGLGNRTSSVVAEPLYHLQDRERWAAASSADQDREIEQAAELLGDEFEKLPAIEFSCGSLRHRLGRFRHAKTGVLFHLIPGSKLSLGKRPPTQLDINRLIPENGPIGGLFPQTTADVVLRFGLALLHTESPPQAPRRIAPFLLAQRELTRGAWVRGGGKAPAAPENVSSDAHPVAPLTYGQASSWLKKNGLRLPSELEWEYACRAGSATRFFWGDVYLMGADHLAAPGGAFSYPLPAGPRLKKKAWNAFGLVDTLGNAEEYCSDPFTWCYPGGQEEGTRFNWTLHLPNLKPTNQDRVVRGGSRIRASIFQRPSARFFAGPGSYGARNSLGLRVARSLKKAKRGR